ncbi:basic salivary proline-rich protein 4-like [Mesoplodon densirostris]|uniref:basic salivary proline-rich protein 4-like n=1 Tax=Mesoplodon densirostris TaxID=48708 RepID=UPI0028DD3E39|nr:basic salivary proline-rich protein 4-like [Mesoplodon densirostris]
MGFHEKALAEPPAEVAQGQLSHGGATICGHGGGGVSGALSGRHHRPGGGRAIGPNPQMLGPQPPPPMGGEEALPGAPSPKSTCLQPRGISIWADQVLHPGHREERAGSSSLSRSRSAEALLRLHTSQPQALCAPVSLGGETAGILRPPPQAGRAPESGRWVPQASRVTKEGSASRPQPGRLIRRLPTPHPRRGTICCHGYPPHSLQPGPEVHLGRSLQGRGGTQGRAPPGWTVSAVAPDPPLLIPPGSALTLRLLAAKAQRASPRVSGTLSSIPSPPPPQPVLLPRKIVRLPKTKGDQVQKCGGRLGPPRPKKRPSGTGAGSGRLAASQLPPASGQNNGFLPGKRSSEEAGRTPETKRDSNVDRQVRRGKAPPSSPRGTRPRSADPRALPAAPTHPDQARRTPARGAKLIPP